VRWRECCRQSPSPACGVRGAACEPLVRRSSNALAPAQARSMSGGGEGGFPSIAGKAPAEHGSALHGLPGRLLPSMARHYMDCREGFCRAWLGTTGIAGKAPAEHGSALHGLPGRLLPSMARHYRDCWEGFCRAWLGTTGIAGKASAEHGSALQGTPSQASPSLREREGADHQADSSSSSLFKRRT